jgi:fibrillarin-like rRNA methylase
MLQKYIIGNLYKTTTISYVWSNIIPIGLTRIQPGSYVIYLGRSEGPFPERHYDMVLSQGVIYKVWADYNVTPVDLEEIKI